MIYKDCLVWICVRYHQNRKCGNRSVGPIQNVACNDQEVKNKFTTRTLIFALGELTSSGEYHKFLRSPPYGEERDLQAINEDCK